MVAKVTKEEARLRKLRRAARMEACWDRLEKYALGELDEEEMTKGQLDALKFLTNKTVPTAVDRLAAQEKVQAPNTTFVITWQNGLAIPQGSRFQTIDATPVVEALPAPEEGS